MRMRIKSAKFHRREQSEPAGEAYGDHTAAIRRPYGLHTGPIRAAYATIRDLGKINGFRMDKDRTVRSWLEKFPEVERFERGRPLKRAVMAGGVVAVVCGVYMDRPPRSILLLSLIALAALVGFDCCRVFSRVFADYSRALISTMLLTGAVTTCWPIKANLIMTIAATLITLAAVRLYNLRWLSAQVYKRSDIVKKALAKEQATPLENFYNSTGAKMVRTIMWEFGLGLDAIEEQAVKAVFVCAYTLGAKVTSETVEEVDQLWRQNAALEDELAERDRVIDETVAWYQAKEEHEAEMAKLQEELKATGTALTAARQEIRDYNTRLLAQAQRIEDLVVAAENEELESAGLATQVRELEAELAEANARLQELEPKEAPVTAIPIKTPEELLAEAASMGYGVDKMMAYAGVTHHKAQKYYEAHKDEVLAARAALAEEA